MDELTVTVRLTAERHRVAGVDTDPRIVWTRCGLLVARVGDRCDPLSVYQRAVFPPCGEQSDCLGCWS